MIYLDNAATTFPKPMAVTEAVLRTLIEPHGNSGRGAHAAALVSAERIFEARKALSELFGLTDERRVIWTKSATEALNTVFFGLLSYMRGKKVLVSTLEHNSVLRPLYHLQERGVIHLRFFNPCEDTEECLRRFCRALGEQTALVALTACANTTGLELPLLELSKEAKRCGALVAVDASQSAGHREMSFRSTGADYLCLPAHKGLFGIMGLGALLIADSAPLPQARLHGGAGFASEKRRMPLEVPERLEAGTLNLPGIAALRAGVEYLQRRGIAALQKKERSLASFLRSELLSLGALVYSGKASSIVLFNVPSLSSQELADRLDEAGICVRAGLHCAPLAHRLLGTYPLGAVRASFSAFNTEQELVRLLQVVKSVV